MMYWKYMICENIDIVYCQHANPLNKNFSESRTIVPVFYIYLFFYVWISLLEAPLNFL